MNPYPIFSVRSHMCVYARVHDMDMCLHEAETRGQKRF